MSVFIEKAGVLDTVQDAGRLYMSHVGVGPAGPMDEWAAAAANALAGNALQAPVLELHYPSAILRFRHPAIIALTGAHFGATINHLPVPLHRTLWVPAQARLHFTQWHSGQRAYLAVQGGWQVSLVLGSCALHVAAGIGGLQGRRLLAGDELPYQPSADMGFSSLHVFPWKVVPPPPVAVPRVLPGPEWHWLSAEGQAAVLAQPFVLQAASSRMALRWQSAPIGLQHPDAAAMLSSPVVKGTIQLLPSGQLLTLMADHQTVGGYPRILQVVRTDLDQLAQLPPGSSVQWQLATMEQAVEALLQQQQDLQNIAMAVQHRLG